MVILIVITIVSIGVAAVMTLVAWRLAREEQLRSDARVEALAADIRGEPSEDRFTHAPPFVAPPPPPRAPSRGLGAFAAGALLVIAVAIMAVVLTDRTRSTPAAATSTAASVVSGPLELVALSHERDGDSLSVRGVVRNPIGNAPVQRLSAAVLVFDRTGRFVTSARAPIERDTLDSGVESTFIVIVPHAEDVGRYRISFRSDDRILSHVDRRDTTVTTQLR
jgi:hypothetical protein